MKQELRKRLHQAKREDIEEALASVILLSITVPNWSGDDYNAGWIDSRRSLFTICNLEQFIK